MDVDKATTYAATLDVVADDTPREGHMSEVIRTLADEVGRLRTIRRDPSFDPECPRCDTDTHRCPGCGQYLHHGQGVCTACRTEHGPSRVGAAQVWAPLALRWRHVTPGDVIIGAKDDQPWMITDVAPNGVRAARGGRSVTRKVDPDETVQVLVPLVERDARALLARELDARQIGPTS